MLDLMLDLMLHLCLLLSPGSSTESQSTRPSLQSDNRSAAFLGPSETSRSEDMDNTSEASEESRQRVKMESDEQQDDGKIRIDSSLIQSAAIQDEDAELGQLGLRLYDQSALESGIRLQVDAAMELMEAKRQKVNTEKRLRTLRNRIGQLSERCRRLQSSTVAAPQTYEQLQRQRRQQAELADLREELAQLRAELSCLETGGSSQDAVCGDQSASALLSGGGESELEAKVRLGEVTPFGTDLSAVTTEPTSSSALLLDSSTARSPPVSPEAFEHVETSPPSTKTPTDQSELSIPRPSAGVNQSALAVSRPSADSSQSDDEYVPSDESADESDEAYVPSDEEEDGTRELTGRGRPAAKGTKRKRDRNGTKRSKTEGKTAQSAAKRLRRAPDDGDPEAYAARIKEWRRERRERRLLRIEQGVIDDEEEERCVEFDGGFRCPASLWDRLFKYQQVGVRWLWELHQQRCGGILGDEMGLGKTIQVIAFLAGLSQSSVRWCGERCGLGPVLVVAPATVLHQWVSEFHRWWPPLRVAVLHESGSHAGSRSSLVRQMGRGRGVLLTSYSALTSQRELLAAQDWHYVLLDEGHKIRNPDAQVTLAVKQVRTPHRVILSGSPLQNNLRELWSLFDFVFPGKLGTLPVFMSQFAVPITQGGYTNASDSQVVTAFRCAKVLRDTIAPYLLRRMKADVQQTLQLPTKNEQVLFCRLTDVQRQMYQDYINSDSLRRILQGRMKVFVGLIALRKLCNHPDLLAGSPGASSGDVTDDVTGGGQFGHWRRAGKMVVLSALLEIWRRQRHKVLLFTQSRQMLTILESFVAGRGYSYLRMDGTTTVGSRQTLIRRFNTDDDMFCFLLTTRVGGLGVNLTGANRIIIYDPDWNPSTDQQARERAWRIGQGRHVTIYRLLTAGTIEEKIYHRQIFKQFLTNRVLKDPKQQRFFKTNDLHDLFTLTEEAASEPEGGGRQGPASSCSSSPLTTETAEIFTGSQVSAAALEARRQREKRQRRQQQAELARQAERRRRKLLEKARSLNRKLFTSGGAPQKNGGKKEEKTKKEIGGGGERHVGKPEVVNSADVERKETAVVLNEEDGSTDSFKEAGAVVTDGKMATDREAPHVTPAEERQEGGRRAEEGKRAEDGARAEDEENTGHGTEISAGARAEDREAAQDGARAANEEREQDGKEAEGVTTTEHVLGGSEDAECLEEGELPGDTEPPAADRSSQPRTEDHTSPGVSTAATVTAGHRVTPSTSGYRAGHQSSDRPLKKARGRAEQDDRKRRRREDDRIKRSGEARRRDRESDERRKRWRRRRVDPLLGEVDGLVDTEVYRPPQTDQDAASDRSQDDYVLTRLFKKSGVHSAVRHDVIEGHGTPDGAILEAEAAQVAREAVAALRASRREVRAAEIGTPTWTGQSGRAGLPARPRFGQKKNPLLAKAAPAPRPPPPPAAKKAVPALPALFAPDTARVSRPSTPGPSTPADNLFGGSAALGLASSGASAADNAPLSSAQLLARIRRRAAGEDGSEAAQVAQEHADLLADIRNFVAFQTSTNGRASTGELLAEFKARLPPQQTPLFKALLTEICDFERGADKTGWWVLREELR